ncbi:MAG: hypothetical protein Q9207_001490 [Kuettlingeria erythrocarpa]
MSSDLLHQQDEDHYFYAPQYDQQGGIDSSGAFMANRDVFANSSQNMNSSNNHALNIDSQFLVSIGPDPQSPRSQNVPRQSFYQTVENTAPGSGLTPLILPGLSKGVSEKQAVHKSPFTSVVANGVGGERADQLGSDLEEGELSEGNVPSASWPRSAEQHPLDGNGTVTVNSIGIRASDSPYMAPSFDSPLPRTTEGIAHDASGAQYPINRQSNPVDSRMVHSRTNGEVKLNIARRAQASTQRQGIKSTRVSKGRARRAVKQLRPHNIGYLQLLREQIDSALLKRLFEELYVDVPELTQIAALPVRTETQVIQVTSNDASVKRNLGSGLKEGIVPPITDKPIPFLDNGLSTQERRTHDNSADQTVTKKRSQEAQDVQFDRDKTSTTYSDKLGRDRAPIQTETGITPDFLAGHSLGVSASSPAVNGGKPAAAQATTQEHVKPPVTTTASKTSALKVVAKPVDRKDYVARLLAAKAGKAAPAVHATKASADLVGRDTLLGNGSQASQASIMDPVRKPENKESKEIGGSSGSTMSNIPQKDAAAEAKKRAQTELARRKIEELRQQSEARKQVSSAANAVTTFRATKEPSPPRQSTQAPPVRATPSAAATPFVANTRQYSYFPLPNATFALPGLSMSSQQSVFDQLSDSAPLAPMSKEPEQIMEPPPVNLASAITDVDLDQAVPKAEASAPPAQENKVLPKTLIAEAPASEAVRSFRKRPTAADFIDPVPAKSRRLNALGADSSVVFDITDDEADENVRDTSEMQLDSDHSMSPSRRRELQISCAGNNEQADFRQHPALSDPYAKLDPSKSTPTSCHTLQASTKHKESGGLKSNEKEIARMKQRIAEMEERRKSKQTASSAHASGLLAPATSLIKPAQSPPVTPSAPDRIRPLSKPASPLQDSGRTLQDFQTTESTLRPGSLAKQRVDDIPQIQVAQPLAPTLNGSGNDSPDQQQRPVRDTEPKKPPMSASVEDYMAKLQKMQKEKEDIQAQLQRKIDDERAVQEEFDRLLQASMTNVEEPKQRDDEKTSFRRDGQVQNSGPGVPHQAQQEQQRMPAEPTSEPGSRMVIELPENVESTTKHTIAPEPSMPKSTMSVDAPTGQSHGDGELAEDVMDISGSEAEDEGEDEDTARGHSPGYKGSAAQPAAETDSEEIYEPPQFFGPIQEKATVSADSKQYHSGDPRSLQQSSEEPKPRTPPVDISRTSRHDAGVVFPPGASERAPSAIDMSDSDDYEPPEPLSSVEDEALINDAASPTSQSSISPPDANQLVKVETAARKLLSLREAQTVADAVEAGGHGPPEMGAVPEGLSAERKHAFVVGLRQIIQEIRGRKVKDFRTVASEIAAYRARFLGDKSKILPL